MRGFLSRVRLVFSKPKPKLLSLVVKSLKFASLHSPFPHFPIFSLSLFSLLCPLFSLTEVKFKIKIIGQVLVLLLMLVLVYGIAGQVSIGRQVSSGRRCSSLGSFRLHYFCSQVNKIKQQATVREWPTGN